MKPENIEFIALIEAAGWKDAHAAARLGLNRSAVSQYRSGKSKPGAQTLALLKMILANERPGALMAAAEVREEALAEWERRVVEDLRWLHKEDRERVLDVVRAMVKGLPKREPVSYSARSQKPAEKSKEAKL